MTALQPMKRFPLVKLSAKWKVHWAAEQAKRAALVARGPIEWKVWGEPRFRFSERTILALTAKEAALEYASARLTSFDDDRTVRIHVGDQVFEIETEVRRERTAVEVEPTSQ